MNKSKEPNSSLTIKELHLEEFQQNNPDCGLAIEGDLLILKSPWGSEDCRLSYSLTDLESISDLNNIVFPAKFNAILHVDTNEVEFIYGYLLPDEEPSKSLCNRSFTLIFEGETYSCRYDAPTDRLFSVAKRIRWMPTEPGERIVPQLHTFKDAQRLEDLPKPIKQYFEKRVPRNFFVKASRPLLDLPLVDIAQHINFAMHYYDRMTPIIDIRHDTSERPSAPVVTLRFCEGSYPNSLVLNKIDEFILQLITVARTTSSRFAFIYYYQVIEYAGFYYMDEKVRKSLKHFLRDPAIMTCPEDKISDLFSIFSDLAQSDESRMRKVIEDCCDPQVLWIEIEHNKKSFTKEFHFDGGFTLAPLISEDTTNDSWASMWMPKLFDQLTKIRNCLVHARERRQSNVILPTPANNIRINIYLPLIARIAEQIALKND